MRLVDIADLVGRDVSLRPTTLAVLGLPIRYRVYRDGRVEEFVISNPSRRAGRRAGGPGELP